MVTGIEDFVKESPDTHWKRLKQYLHDEIFTLNFYRVHMSYFVFATLISSVIIYGPGLAVDPDEVAGNRLRYIDALFLSCSAMTTTGKLFPCRMSL